MKHCVFATTVPTRPRNVRACAMPALVASAHYLPYGLIRLTSAKDISMRHTAEHLVDVLSEIRAVVGRDIRGFILGVDTGLDTIITRMLMSEQHEA